MNAAMLSLRIEKKVRSVAGAQFALDVAAEFPPGFTVLFGPSGAGKSTLLDCVAGLQSPDEGFIRLGENVYFDAVRKIAMPVPLRRVGYVFQSLALFPHLTVEENVTFGLFGLPVDKAQGRVQRVLEAFRVEELRLRKPGQISGGEQQRVALARSLVTQPRLLLLDEPLGGLDAHLKRAILEDLRMWNATSPIPILYVTHSHDEVKAFGERVVAMEAGKITQQGDSQEILGAPRTRALAEISGFENLFQARVKQRNGADGVMRVALQDTLLELEVPLVQTQEGDAVQVAIRAGDILLATEQPRGLSARNVFVGRVVSLESRNHVVAVRVDAGVPFVVYVTPSAARTLKLTAGCPLWLVVKTHSCHLVSQPPLQHS